MGVDDVGARSGEPPPQREHPAQALPADREVHRIEPAPLRFAVDPRFARRNHRDPVSAGAHAGGLLEDADLLAAPALRGLRVDDVHAAGTEGVCGP